MNTRLTKPVHCNQTRISFANIKYSKDCLDNHIDVKIIFFDVYYGT